MKKLIVLLGIIMMSMGAFAQTWDEYSQYPKMPADSITNDSTIFLVQDAEKDSTYHLFATDLQSAIGGDVTKVGNPVDGQIGVWTGDGTIEGGSDFTFDGTGVFSITESSGFPGIYLSADGGANTSGFYASANDATFYAVDAMIHTGIRHMYGTTANSNTFLGIRNSVGSGRLYSLGVFTPASETTPVFSVDTIGTLNISIADLDSRHSDSYYFMGNTGFGAYYSTDSSSTVENASISLGHSTSGSNYYPTVAIQARHGGNASSIVIDSSSMKVADVINTKGLEYAADYSANYTVRSLVDQEYVTDYALAKADTLEVNYDPITIDTAYNGAQTSITISVDTSATGIATQYDITQLGAGNVTKVGTPVDNQIGVWTGDGTLEGDTDLAWLNANARLVVGGSADADLQIIDATAGSAGLRLNVTDDNESAITWRTGMQVAPNQNDSYVSFGIGGAASRFFSIRPYDTSTPADTVMIVESSDGTNVLSVLENGELDLGGSTVSSTELGVLEGATVTTAELNAIVDTVSLDSISLEDAILDISGGGTGMYVAIDTVLYSNTTQTTIITLPADAVVWEIGVEIATAFTGTAQDTIDVGTTASGALFVDNQPASSTGFFNSQTLPSSVTPSRMSASTNITFQYVDTNADAGAGLAYVYVHYSLH